MATISFRGGDDLRDEIRGAVVTVQKTKPRFSKDELLKLGARLALQQLAAEHNDGKPFKKLRTPLTAGKRPDAQ